MNLSYPHLLHDRKALSIDANREASLDHREQVHMVERMPSDKEPAASVQSVARELYGLRPEEFVQERDSRAAELASVDADFARQIKRLRKPTTAAWALNLLVRTRADDVSQLVGLGAAFRDAQASFSADQLQQLEPQRKQILREIAQSARQAAEDAGQPLSDTISADVEEALRSAMADEAAGSALATGLLVRSIDANGLDPADLHGAIAIPDPTPMIEPTSPRDHQTTNPTSTDSKQRHQRSDGAAVRVAEQALREAQQHSAAAASALDAARQTADAAALRRESLERERQDLQTQLTHVNEQLRDAKLEESQSKKEAQSAQRNADKARRAEQSAAAELQRDRR
jgi:hypothetical protein